MVLIDPTDRASIVAAGRPLLPISQYRLTWLLARIGLIRRFGAALVASQIGRPAPSSAGPPPRRLGAIHLRSCHRRTSASVDSAQDIETLITSGVWSDLPVIVVTAGRGGNPDYGQRLASLTTAGKQSVAEESSHYVHYDQPALILQAAKT
ncbi:MAG: hypothetical protein LC739_13405 [Actinobacteria bacterium]|nr:hypothetical protein [Actinomycetota bacterium]